MSEGPHQVWTWSRIDGRVSRTKVTPSKLDGRWVEEYPGGWSLWPGAYLCDTPEEAVRQARAHFQRIADDAQAVLARMETDGQPA